MHSSRRKSPFRAVWTLMVGVILAVGGAATTALFASCGPFTDFGTLICPFVLELYYSGITAGTSSTTYSPNDPVTRGQMAIFTSTALDLSLARSSRRAALGQWWTTTPYATIGLGVTPVGLTPQMPAADGMDIWVPAFSSASVTRVRASDGSVLGTWTGVPGATQVLVAMGRVFVTGHDSAPGSGTVAMIDPTQQPGPVTVVATGLQLACSGIAFDGARIWTANTNTTTGGSVSIITPSATLPWPAVTVTAGFNRPLLGIAFDGSSMWVTEELSGLLHRLDANGNIIQSVTLGLDSPFPVFDGKNIWVPNSNDGTISVVRASTGTVLATLTGNGLAHPSAVAFDGA
jgi:hypothetical protein